MTENRWVILICAPLFMAPGASLCWIAWWIPVPWWLKAVLMVFGVGSTVAMFRAGTERVPW